MRPRRTVPLDAIGIGLAAGFALAIAGGALANLVQKDVGGADPADQTPAGDALPVAAAMGSADPIRRTATVEAVERVAPAVVSITTEQAVADPFLRRGGRTRSSEGSGVVIASDGVVLTNAHVVEGASRIRATFADGAGYEADVIGIAPELDLAVLRLRGGAGLIAVPQGTSSDLMLGEPVIAIGNPFGLGHTVTTGVISATRRPLATDDRVYQDFIQTDASINPGNSGGPLINARGVLVGINTAVQASGQGIGFAIPADRALKVARDLVDFGSVQVPWLGLDLSDVAITGPQGHSTAARVDRVHPGTSAAAAGVAVGDILIAVDGRPVQGRSDLNAWLAGFSPDPEVEVELLTAGKARRLRLAASKVPADVVKSSIDTVLGLQLADTDGAGLTVLALRPDGGAARAGIRPGDRILALNGSSLATVADLEAAIGQAKSGHRANGLALVRRGDARGRLMLPL